MVQRMAMRDAGALDSFFHMCSGALMGIAVQMLGSHEDAEEVLQDTLVKVWNKAPAYDPLRSAPYTWAVMILRGCCLDRLRLRQRRLQPLPLAPDWDAPSLQVCDPAVLADVRAAWAALADADQALLSRAIFEPLTSADIAARTGEPVGTIKARIHRALGRFFHGIHGADATTPDEA